MNIADLTDEAIDGMAAIDLAGAIHDATGFYLPGMTSDIRLAHRLEARLAEMGLADRYAATLYAVLHADKNGPPTPFELIHASPRDRCRAALRAVRDARREQGDG